MSNFTKSPAPYILDCEPMPIFSFIKSEPKEPAHVKYEMEEEAPFIPIKVETEGLPLVPVKIEPEEAEMEIEPEGSPVKIEPEVTTFKFEPGNKVCSIYS